MAVTTTCEEPELREVAKPRGLAFQTVLLGGALALYLATRRLTVGDAADAAKNARDILHLESLLGLDIEHEVQKLILDIPSLITLMNWIYVWGHWPVLAATAIWLFIKHRSQFNLFRNALIISGLMGLVVFALFPVMPPRLLGTGMVDTVARWSSSYHIMQPPSLVNQYAAVPSFHVGWNVLAAYAIFQALSHTNLRFLAFLMPIAMVSSVVLTGNHYLFDAFAGILLVTVAWRIGTRFAAAAPASRTTGDAPNDASTLSLQDRFTHDLTGSDPGEQPEGRRREDADCHECSK